MRQDTHYLALPLEAMGTGATDRPIGRFTRRSDAVAGVTNPPARWRYADIAAYRGVAPRTAITYNARGLLPPPDGHDGTPWWWATTIQSTFPQTVRRGRPRKRP